MESNKTYVWNKKPKYKAPTRKQRRIKEHGTETELFARIWEERPHECQECGKYLHEPKPHNFDHILGKGIAPELRYEPTNIALVCFACHSEKTTGQKYKGADFD